MNDPQPGRLTELEELGEYEVIERLNAGYYEKAHSAEVLAWLSERIAARKAFEEDDKPGAPDAADKAAFSTSEMARDAIRTAASAKILAKLALAISIAAIAISIIVALVKL